MMAGPGGRTTRSVARCCWYNRCSPNSTTTAAITTAKRRPSPHLPQQQVLQGIAQQDREAHAERHDMMFGFNVAHQ
jgi:hypothetical protein